jgi:hypothetical protein
MTAGVKVRAKSFMLPKRNMVNPTFRPIGGQVVPQGRLMGWRVEERWRKQTPLCNRVDRGGQIAPLRKRADFQQVMSYESVGRTFAGGNRK